MVHADIQLQTFYAHVYVGKRSIEDISNAEEEMNEIHSFLPTQDPFIQSFPFEIQTLIFFLSLFFLWQTWRTRKVRIPRRSPNKT